MVSSATTLDKGKTLKFGVQIEADNRLISVDDSIQRSSRESSPRLDVVIGPIASAIFLAE